MMNVRRGAISRIVNNLIADGVIFEGATGQAVRGRKPTFLYIDSRRRAVVAADIRASETFLLLADLRGNPTSDVIRMPTSRDPRELAPAMAERIKRMLVENREVDACDGVGVVVPGMVEHSTMRVLHAPTLGWKDVDLHGPLAAATGLPVQIENSGRACALAQAWAVREAAGTLRDVVFVSVSEGVGVGVMIHGELLRGRNNVAGEFGHVPLSLEALAARAAPTAAGKPTFPIAPLSRATSVSRSTTMRSHPVTALNSPSRISLRGRAGGTRKLSPPLKPQRDISALASALCVNTFDPACVYIGGEITRAWDLIEPTVRAAMAERALTAAAAATDVRAGAGVRDIRACVERPHWSSRLRTPSAASLKGRRDRYLATLVASFLTPAAPSQSSPSPPDESPRSPPPPYPPPPRPLKPLPPGKETPRTRHPPDAPPTPTDNPRESPPPAPPLAANTVVTPATPGPPEKSLPPGVSPPWATPQTPEQTPKFFCRKAIRNTVPLDKAIQFVIDSQYPIGRPPPPPPLPPHPPHPDPPPRKHRFPPM